MPGILPMKVIKVGSSAQPRIAQACDRCRSKKIRCDGIRPSCTQCLNVGFECKTSDKLSRRAFPRGYTESLEERVRALEAEVRELKDLLDEKEEKLDMLFRVRSGSSQASASPKRTNDNSPPPASAGESTERASPDVGDVFKVTQSPILVNEEHPNTYFMGTSSCRALICALKRKVQEEGKSSIPIDVNAFFAPKRNSPVDMSDPTMFCRPPPRIMSDRLFNIYFQEIGPLFPILHRTTSFQLYEEFVSSPDEIRDPKSLAQLYLVFSIAGLFSQSGASPTDIESFETQWRMALESFMTDESLLTVQCLTLATLYFMMKADYAAMLRYKGHAVGLSERLGLHQAQKRFTFNVLTIETRKKVFWSLFTLDCFSAAHLGLPTLISEPDVHCEYPVDADDEYVTEKGFLPTLPGESTRLSPGLALFRLSRVMWKILKELYPTAASYELSFRKIAALQDELDNWSTELAPHLRLHFDQDKPSTRMTADRSPMLSLAYQYTHTLISRPAVLAAASSQARSTPSILSLASSSKKIIQISDLLQERNLAFAFCLNENEVLLQAAFGLLFEVLELGPESASQKDDAKLVCAVANMLTANSVPGVPELRRIMAVLLKETAPPPLRKSSEERRSSSNSKKGSQKNKLKAFASRLAGSTEKASDPPRRVTYPYMPSPAAPQLEIKTPLFARSEPSLSPPQGFIRPQSTSKQARRSIAKPSMANSHLISLANMGTPNMPLSLTGDDIASSADWERMLSNLDNGQTTIYDGIYGGPGGQPPSLGGYSSLASTSSKRASPPNPGERLNGENNMADQSSWSPQEIWASTPHFSMDNVHVPQSVMSFTSDENSTSVDDVDLAFQGQNSDNGYGKAILIPGVGSPTIMGSSSELDMFANLDMTFGV